jgi:hypothetical protein
MVLWSALAALDVALSALITGRMARHRRRYGGDVIPRPRQQPTV